MNIETLWAAIEHRLCVDYARAFSQRDLAALRDIYCPNSVVIIHQLGRDKSGRAGQGKTTAIDTGNLLTALLRWRMPATVAAKAMFRRLEQQDYDHSEIKLLAIEDLSAAGGPPRARANCSYERFRGDGESYETGFALYNLAKIDGAWRITEIWTYDDIKAAPPSLQLDKLTRPHRAGG
jgi:hypothetical protein